VPKHTLNAKGILQLLEHYPDQRFPQTLAGIATYGARLGYEGTQSAKIRLKNHKSVFEQSIIVEEGINEDLKLHRTRVVDSLPEAYYISPLGVVPKTTAGATTGWRRIHDLSAPTGRSVNDGIPKHYGTIAYETFQFALRHVAKAGRGCKLIKRDLKSAFRFVPVSPYDHWLLMYEWNGRIYVELFLPFGLRTAPLIFNLFSEAIHWIMQLKGYNLCHYIDDFLLILPPGSPMIHTAANDFSKVCDTMGFMIEPKKNKEGTLVDFLGLEIDTMAMEARLPPDKHQRALSIVTDVLQMRSISFHTLEKLLGFLSFCCAVIPLGRPFLRQIFNLLNRKTYNFAHIRISKAAKRDLHWWTVLLHQWNGVAVIHSLPRPVITIYTDASGTKGIGGIWGNKAFSVHLNRRHRTKHINWKEMFAIFFAVSLWADEWIGCRVILMCDNSAVVEAINKKSMRGITITILQFILLIACIRDIELHSEWLSSEDNAIADALSRHQFDRLTILCEQQGFSPILLRNSTHLRNYRKKLLSSYGMDSLLLPEERTSQPSTSTKHSQDFDEHNHSLHQSTFSQHGSRRRSSRRRPRQPRNTFKASEVTTSTWASTNRRSTIHVSKESSEAEKGITGMSTNEKDFPLQGKSSSASYSKSPILTTDSTIKLRSVSVSPHSCVQENSPTISGRKHPRTSRSLAPPLVSKKMTALSSPFQHLRRTTSAKEFASPLPRQRMDHRHVQSSRYAPSSTASQQAPRPRYSQRPSVPSHEIISSRQLEMLSSMQVSAQPVSLVTPFEEGRQSLPSQQAFHGMKSKHWEGGGAMQLTYTSNPNPQKYLFTPENYTPRHSYLLPTSLASSQISPVNQFNPTMIWAV
jgi:Reverse transcriptase (RNA-dependent DNA polymerase)